MKTKRNQKNLKFQFLKDEPLNENQIDEIQFGHKEIGKTLVNIIESCPNPFTIGLFGKWGCGKITIANLLRKDLKTKKIPVINSTSNTK